MNNYIAETSVIGSILQDRSCIPSLLSVLSADDFSLKVNSEIYAAVKKMYEGQEIIDPITVQKESGADYSYLAETIGMTPTATNVMEYAEIVKNYSMLRQLREIGEFLKNDDGEPSAIITEVNQRLESIRLGNQSLVLNAGEACMDFMEHRQRIDKGEQVFVPTGFSKLDNILGGGLLESGLYFIAGRPGMGKTTFGAAVLKNMVKSKIPCLFVSLEMSSKQLMAKLVASETNINSNPILVSRLGNEEYQKVTRSVSEIAEYPFYQNKKPTATVDDIANMTIAVRGLRCVFVDYFGLVQTRGKNESRVEAYTGISNDMKRLAKRLNIPIVCMAQLNRQNEQRSAGNRRPQLSDLRETGAAEQDADGVIFLHREDYYNKQVKTDVSEFEIIVEKNRHGATGTVKMAFYPATSKITN